MTAVWAAEWTVGDGAFDRLRDPGAWARAAAQPNAHVFHRLDLLRVWSDTIGAAVQATPALAVVAQDGGRCARLATAVVPHRGSMVTRRVLEHMGQDLFGYHDPLFDTPPDPASLESFWSVVRETAPAHDQAWFKCVDPQLGSARLALPFDEQSPVLRLTGAASLEDVLARTSANHRGDVGRRLRRMRERGSLVLHVYSPDESAAARRDFRERCWPAWVGLCQRKGYTLHQRPGFAAYCERLIEDGCRAGFTHFAALRVDGVDVAWHLGLAHQRRLYWWLPAHDERWQEWSPGKVLLALVIEELVNAGFHELHFQTGAQPYKLAWQPDQPRRVAVGWHAGSWRARAVAAYDRFRARDRR